MPMLSGLIEIIGVAALVFGLLTFGLMRLQKRHRPDRASLQAQLDMIAAAIDPEYRKRD
jgi:cell shape-determining protein MreD